MSDASSFPTHRPGEKPPPTASIEDDRQDFDRTNAALETGLAAAAELTVSAAVAKMARATASSRSAEYAAAMATAAVRAARDGRRILLPARLVLCRTVPTSARAPPSLRGSARGRRCGRASSAAR